MRKIQPDVNLLGPMTRTIHPVCPECGQRMLIREGVRLPPFLADLFDIIDRSGKRGIVCELLADVLYPGQSLEEARRRVRVNVHRLNSFLVSTDTSVASRPNGYGRGPYRVHRKTYKNGAKR